MPIMSVEDNVGYLHRQTILMHSKYSCHFKNSWAKEKSRIQKLGSAVQVSAYH